MIFKHMDRIVFAGDSVTDMESAQPVGEGLFENVGKSYVRIVENMLAAFYPEVYLRVTNSGIGGNTSRDLLQRFDRGAFLKGGVPDSVLHSRYTSQLGQPRAIAASAFTECSR